jgi:hypothetical protein
MRRILAAVGLAAIPIQAAERGPAPHTHAPAATAKEAAPAPMRNEAPPAAPGAGKGTAQKAYRSPFAGYRPFDPNEPAKDWREANEEVRAVGGHAGAISTGKGVAGK